MLAVMLTAPFLLTQGVWPGMKHKGWGRIVNIGSIHSQVASQNKVGYTSAKHGLIGLTKTAALEGGAAGITANAICPGPIRTSMLERRIRFNSENEGIPIEEVEKSFNPIQRLLEPPEVAAIAVHLALDEAKFMTGQAINIDAGMVVH